MSPLSPIEVKRCVDQLKREIQRGIVGQELMVESLIEALLVGGHVLVEGVPGLGKTRAVNLLAKACGAEFKRVQFTPDLLPADIIGTRIYNQETREFETRKGPIFTQFVLADEINRAAPKVQSALLEAMQERQVTLGDHSWPLPKPFFVFATQNPVEQEGTYPLPEAQVDRFLMKVVVPYPSLEEEQAIVQMVMNEMSLPEVEKAIDPEWILLLQEATRGTYVDDRLILYAARLVAATRQADVDDSTLQGMIELGASPRASIALIQVARAHALVHGRGTVVPEDLKAVAERVLQHRILPTYHAEAEGISPSFLVAEILKKVAVP